MFASGKEDDPNGVDPQFAAQVLQNLGQGNEMSECMICTGEIEGEVILPCYHNGWADWRFAGCCDFTRRLTLHCTSSCRDCIVACIERAEDLGQTPVCPACSKGPLSVGQLREAVRSKNRFGADKLSLRKVDFQTSTKLKALVKKLELLKEQDPLFKALVFSQVRMKVESPVEISIASE
jgi:DNA repair protein RAD5